MSVLVTLGWIVAAAAAAFVTAELLARAALRSSGYYVWQRYYRRTLHVDRESHPQLEPVVHFEANAQGERGGTYPGGPGTLRVLLLGGSTVESALSDQTTCWSQRLQVLLSSAESRCAIGVERVHVGNVGRSGLDVHAVGQIIARTGPQYHGLDAIGIMVGPGDMLRWLEEGAPSDRLPPRIALTTVFAESPLHPVGWHPKRLALVEFVRRARARLLRPDDVREKAARWMGGARRQRQSATRVITEVPLATTFLDRYEADLDATLTQAVAQARMVLLLRQPSLRKSAYTAEEEGLFWNGGIGNAFRGDIQTEFFSTEVMYSLLDQMDERMRRLAATHGVRFVDPMPGLTMSTASFYDHFHLTAVGAEELARALAPEFVGAARGSQPSRRH